MYLIARQLAPTKPTGDKNKNMKQAALSSYYASSAFDPPEESPLPSDIIGTGFDYELVEMLDEIECYEGFGSSVNWYVAAQKCDSLMMEEIMLAVQGEYEFTLSEMKSDFIKIIKDCD